MSASIEQKLRNAFAGLGSFGKLVNGFRQQTRGQQSSAVYFSGNMPGNLVEIGLSPRALAPLLDKSERTIAEWIRQQEALTGRERMVSGKRGSYPGLAIGSERELDTFLEAWGAFRQKSAKPADANLPAVTQVEKTANDSGFDLTPAREDGWLVFRSSAFSLMLGVLTAAGDQYRVGFSDAHWGQKVAHDCDTEARPEPGPWPTIVDPVTGEAALRAMIQRAGRVAHLLAGEAATQFADEMQKPPAATEVERLVRQRVGQDVFRRALIGYWRGRCAVTGLSVEPLLVASHIRPWARCDSDAERLDVFNGLLLAPHLDALFDGGWISFGDDGGLLVSPELPSDQCALLGVQRDWRLTELAEQHFDYLTWHRREIFRK